MNLIKSQKNIFIFILLFAIPIFSQAQINLNEIMFDPQGTDTDREWIEIINTDGVSVDLEKYKICDSGSCHKLYDGFGNDFNIPAHSFGIIAKKPEKFKDDYSNFSGFILKASFSLTNSSELIELKNSNGVVISQVEYNVDVGGKNGNTFSLISDTWKNGKATPNAENIFKKKEVENSSSSNSGSKNEKEENQKIQRTYVEITDEIDGKKKLKAEIIGDIPALIAGAENEFHGRAYGITGVEIRGAEYFWYFGDGEKEYGKNTKHTFLYPGGYVLTLVVKSASFTGNVRKIVKVIEPPLEISAVDSQKNWIKVKNNYPEILKLDSWRIFVDGDEFEIPKETYILGKSEVIFPNKITNLDVREDSNIYLLFPNGQKVAKFVKKNKASISSAVVVEKINIQENTEKKENIEKVSFSTKVKNKIKKIFSTKKENKKTDKIVKKEQGDLKDNFSFNDDFEKNSFFGVDEKMVRATREPTTQTPPIKPKLTIPTNAKIENLKLKTTSNFLLEHIYFLAFVFLNIILVVISFSLNYWEKKEKNEIELNSEVKEYFIEEI